MMWVVRMCMLRCVRQLREMMEVADTDGDHLISFEEYAAAYGLGPWVRAQVLRQCCAVCASAVCAAWVVRCVLQGIYSLMNRILAMWKSLDQNNSGKHLTAAPAPTAILPRSQLSPVRACREGGLADGKERAGRLPLSLLNAGRCWMAAEGGVC